MPALFIYFFSNANWMYFYTDNKCMAVKTLGAAVLKYQIIQIRLSEL